MLNPQLSELLLCRTISWQKWRWLKQKGHSSLIPVLSLPCRIAPNQREHSCVAKIPNWGRKEYPAGQPLSPVEAFQVGQLPCSPRLLGPFSSACPRAGRMSQATAEEYQCVISEHPWPRIQWWDHLPATQQCCLSNFKWTAYQETTAVFNKQVISWKASIRLGTAPRYRINKYSGWDNLWRRVSGGFFWQN